jgi:hypothetical protein
LAPQYWEMHLDENLENALKVYKSLQLIEEI